MSCQALERPELDPRQARTVERLLEAGAEELRAVGVGALTIRTFALRADVSPATAYTCFDSKDHFFAKLFWRHLQTHPAPRHTSDDVGARLRALTRHFADMLANFPEMAAAATRALLGSDPGVGRLRRRIGAEYLARFETALGPRAHPDVLDGAFGVVMRGNA